MKTNSNIKELLARMNESDFASEANTLLYFTDGCRADMHEPDEQNISAGVSVGRGYISGGFDNAGIGGEMTLVLINTETKATENINMASLVALARLGAELYIQN